MENSTIAAGGLITRHGARGTEVVVVHRPAYDDWSFPKGKQDPGEHLEETALREVWEETMLECVLGAYIGIQEYPRKTVHYWVMQVAKEAALLPNEEIDDLRWVTAEEARALLSYPQDRELLGVLEGLSTFRHPPHTADSSEVSADKNLDIS